MYMYTTTKIPSVWFMINILSQSKYNLSIYIKNYMAHETSSGENAIKAFDRVENLHFLSA